MCRVTEIPFKTLFMGVGQLQDTRWQHCLRSLTKEDMRRLGSLQKKEECQEISTYMLEHQVKLEQEIVCYYLMADKKQPQECPINQ